MTKPTKMTELEAVNVMLTTIGEAPVNTLTGNQVTDVTIAQQVLNEVNREVQSQGWYFNTENGVTLTPDNNKHILPPADTARIDSRDYNIVIREDKLFDLDDFTYEFGGSIKVNIVYYQDFTVLPDAAKRYIAARAARIYADRLLNSETIHAMTLRDEQKALVDLRQFEEETADYTMMDSLAVSRITNRGFRRRIL